MIDLDKSDRPDFKDLQHHYGRCYAHKFKTPAPRLPGDEDVFLWLANEYGKERGQEIISSYFRTADKFLEGKGYPPYLLKKNIHGLIAQGPAKEPKPRQQLMIRVETYCPACKNNFHWVGHPKEIDSIKTCEKCSK